MSKKQLSQPENLQGSIKAKNRKLILNKCLPNILKTYQMDVNIP
uniref:Uncharacterized protein n=1 Tax=Anguilla anguilla TaxID=7936 RepID=A0A0E9QQV3_ANGAN